jgi:DNA-binding NtrC family response regulator
MKALMNYDWPGNVRELENCVERAVALGNGQVIDLSDLPPSIACFNPPEHGLRPDPSSLISDIRASSDLRGTSDARTPSDLAGRDLTGSGLTRTGELLSNADGSSSIAATDLEDIERATIQRVFQQVHGDKALAGRMLGISRATLYRKLKRYNITGNSDSSASSHTLQ